MVNFYARLFSLRALFQPFLENPKKVLALIALFGIFRIRIYKAFPDELFI